MYRRLNNTVVWVSVLTVFLPLVVESHPPVDDDADDTSSTVSSAAVAPQAGGQQQPMSLWARANPVRRRPRPPPPSSSVKLVGVDVRRVTEVRADTGDNDAAAANWTSHGNSDVDMSVTDQLRLARIRSDFHGNSHSRSATDWANSLQHWFVTKSRGFLAQWTHSALPDRWNANILRILW